MTRRRRTFGSAALALALLLPVAGDTNRPPVRPYPTAFWPPPVLSPERAEAVTLRIDGRGGGVFDTGTGVAVGEHVVLTNAHLIEGRVTIVTRCGDVDLEVLRLERHPSLDLAVAEVAGPPLVAVQLAAADPVAGTRVVVPGYPGGAELALVQARVDGTLDRVGGVLVRFSPDPLRGQSGSPLLDRSGRLAGLAYARDEAGGQGLAYPPSTLRPALEGFRASGFDVADPVAGAPGSLVPGQPLC